MPIVLKQGSVEVRIQYREEHPIVHCYYGSIESNIRVEIDLYSLLVTGYGDGGLPNGDFLLEALLLVRKNVDLLLEAYKEIKEI